MTEQHTASAEQWRQIEGYAASDHNDDYAACLLDIRARVEALLTNHFRDARNMVPTPASSLVERVADAMAKEDWMNSGLDEFACQDSDPTYRYTSASFDDGLDVGSLQARAAIREVAAWLRSEYPKREGYGTAWANMLEQEADRG